MAQIQHFSQVLHFSLQFLNQGVFHGVDLVRLNPRHHLLRSVCELQSRYRLFYIVNDWRYCGDKHRACVSAQRILKNSCELRIPVGNMQFLKVIGFSPGREQLRLSLKLLSLFGQGRDDLAQSSQTKIDGLEFVHVDVGLYVVQSVYFLGLLNKMKQNKGILQ